MARNQARSGRKPSQQRQSNRDSGRSGFLTSVLGIAGGIGIGAGLMYLLDPNRGEQRRHQIADKASGLAHTAWDSVSEHAADAGSMIAGAAPMVGERLMDQARGAGAETRETARGWIDSARSHLPELPHVSDMRERFASLNPFQRRGSNAAPIAAAAASAGLAALALGATAMYLLDPDRGRGRRAWIGQKLSRARRETGQFMRATGRHLANKGQGYYHETRSAAQEAMDSAVAPFRGMSGAPGGSQQQASGPELQLNPGPAQDPAIPSI